MSSGYIITLVHGTFSRNARWTRLDSDFCKLLTQGLQGKAVLRRFDWSGENSESARQAAARDLRKDLRSCLARNTCAQHFIIAHSHGGNVVLQAVTGTELESGISGIICLSVPFLHVNPRFNFSAQFKKMRFKDLANPNLMSYMLLIQILCMSLSLPGMCLAGLSQLSRSTSESPSWEWPILIAADVLTSVFAWLFFKKAWKAAKQFCEPYQRKPSVVRLMILRIVGDEATGVLTASSFSAWLSRQVYRTIAWPFKVKWSPGNILLALIALPVLSFVVVAEYASALPLWLITTICILPFGLDLALVGTWVEAYVGDTPVGSGNWYISVLPPPESDFMKGFRHSAIYDDPRIVPISAWINSEGKTACIANPRVEL